MGKALVLHLKTEYFKAIVEGSKLYEYRRFNDYWKKRIENHDFDHIDLYCGYPKKDTPRNRIKRPWCGFRVFYIRHPEFGNKYVQVFAIRVNP